MKKLITILLLGSLLCTSCEKFLDIQPRSQVELDKLFEDEKGFQDALTGVYIQMKSGDAYGGRLTQTTIENLTNSWDVTSASAEQKLSLFAFTDQQVDDALSAIFSKQYAIIASANAILDNIDERKSVFKTVGLYELIKGEALAIRAYVHLDLLRLYGPNPTNPSEGSQLTYVTQLSKAINTPIPFEEFRTLLLKDISDAQTLLKDIDPVLTYSLQELRNPNPNSGTGFRTDNDFFAFRAVRMNYFAVKALEARAQLWFGNKTQAYLAAKEVVDAKNSDNSPKFRLGVETDFTNGDYVLREEHIFGLYDIKMYEWYPSRYSNGTLRKGSSATSITNNLYGNTGKDIRETRLWSLVTQSNGARTYVIRKYETKDPKTVTRETDFKQIPMLRSSEMYLILAETAPFAEGINYLKQFRLARNITVPDPATELDLNSEIVKEYRREFYAEGQGFFNYKRNNVTKSAFVFIPSTATINYLPPLPTVELQN